MMSVKRGKKTNAASRKKDTLKQWRVKQKDKRKRKVEERQSQKQTRRRVKSVYPWRQS